MKYKASKNFLTVRKTDKCVVGSGLFRGMISTFFQITLNHGTFTLEGAHYILVLTWGKGSFTHKCSNYTNLADSIEAILLEVLIIEGHSVGPNVERLPGVHPGERVGDFQGSRLSNVAVDPLGVVGGGLTARTQLFIKRPDLTYLVELHQLRLGGGHLPGVADLEGGQDEYLIARRFPLHNHSQELLVQVSARHHVDVDDQDVGGLGATSGHITKEVIGVGDVSTDGVVLVLIPVGLQSGEHGGTVLKPRKVLTVLLGEARHLT